MRVSEFDFELPESLIALSPAEPRDACRLLVIDRGQRELSHRTFCDLPEFLRPGDLLILNDTKVFPARLQARKATGGRVEILLVRELSDGSWEILSKGGHSGTVLVEDRAKAELQEGKRLRFHDSRDDVFSLIREVGRMPLPPYIKRSPCTEDRIWYQTVYAEREGSIAAPTAGLHFTRDLMKSLEDQGVLIRFVTLHVGVGTFKPVTAELVREHRMDPEYFEVDEALIEEIRLTKAAGRRVVTTGTTATRALEAFAAGAYEKHAPGCADAGHGRVRGSTDLFICPGHSFSAADALITNFHLPRSTPLMLTAAFSGPDLLFRAYADAVSLGYRFFSYGDAMLIL